MSLRYIVGIDPLDKNKEQQFRNFIIMHRGTWWHWISNMWLLKLPDGAGIDANDIYNKIMELNPEARVFIEKVSSPDWMVTDLTKGTSRMAGWLEKHWVSDDD